MQTDMKFRQTKNFSDIWETKNSLNFVIFATQDNDPVASTSSAGNKDGNETEMAPNITPDYETPQTTEIVTATDGTSVIVPADKSKVIFFAW